MKIQDKQSILFTGDSITDCGRARPVGMGGGLGSGYVALVDSLLAACHPERGILVLNTGISGNRVTDLETRWQTDVLDLKPDWLSVMIGVNDVWRHFDNHLNADQVGLKRYESTYRRILEQTRGHVSGLVLMTPFFLEPNRADPMRAQLDAYGEVVERLANEFDAVFVNVQAAFDAYLTHRPTQSLCGDRVHPNQTGHLVIAKTFLTAMAFEWTREAI
ncbi:MAG: SGNH/GDSL hydrolase family protein [Chloroflexota bacterium]